MTTRTSSSRRPPPDRPAWASPSPAGHCANSPTTCPPSRTGPSAWDARPCAACWSDAASPSSAPSTWKESTDPDYDTKLDRIEYLLEHSPDRLFAFDEFGPLGIRPTAGSSWSPSGRPDRLPATYHRTHGVTYFHGCYSVGDDALWGVNRRRKSAVNSLAALKSIRAARPDGALHAYLRWRNTHARHPDVLAAQRRERARIRSEKGIRWGGRPLTAAA